MQFTISKSELQTALGICGKCVGGNIIPAHSNYLFNWDNTGLTISATDGERLMSYTANVDGKESFKFQLPATKLNDLVKLISDQPLIFTIGKTAVTIKTATGKYELPFEPGEDYPIATHNEKFNFDISAEDFRNGLGKVLFATSDNTLFPDLVGVLLELDGGVTYTACNGAMLSTFKQDGETPKGEVILSQKSVSTITGSPANETINISIGDTSIQVKLNDNTTLFCRVIDEKYRAYRGVIPKDNTNLLVINRVELLASINRMRVFANEIEKLLIVTLSLGSELVISTTNLLSQTGTEQLHGTYTGDAFSLNFHAGYMISCLQHLECENVYIYFADNKRGFVLREAESTEAVNLMMVMPFYKP